MNFKSTLSIKKMTILLFATTIMNCKPEPKSKPNSIVAKPLTTYSSVREMLDDSGDFYEENDSLKFISVESQNFHIQVSKPISKNDLEKVKQETVIRNIVYVTFQTFAQTNTDKIIITSIPSDLENKYYHKYKETLSITRTQAKSTLKKFLNTDDFSTLFTYENGIWLPNRNFEKLKFEKLQEVYKELSKK